MFSNDYFGPTDANIWKVFPGKYLNLRDFMMNHNNVILITSIKSKKFKEFQKRISAEKFLGVDFKFK